MWNRLLVTVGLWLARRGGWTPPIQTPPLPPIPPDFGLGALIAEAKTILAAIQYNMGNASGEAKRHQALSVLKKRLPTAATRDLALAIELALR